MATKLKAPARPYSWRVTNTVCTARVSRTFSRDAMKTLPQFIPGCYDGEIFPPVVFRFVDPKVTCGLFPTGKIVACGAPHQDIAKLAMAKVVSMLSEHFNEQLHLIDFNLENIVASARLPYKLNLALYHADNFGREHPTVYHPEKFPGIHQFLGPVKPCIVIFDSGALLVTGIRDLDTAARIVAKIPFHFYQLGHTYRTLETASQLELDAVAKFTQLSTKEQKKQSRERLQLKVYRKRHPMLVAWDRRNVLLNHWPYVLIVFSVAAASISVNPDNV